MTDQIDRALGEMSLWERVQLCSCMTMALTNKEIKQLGIPPLTAIDGPYGIRKAAVEDVNDNLGISASKPSTCFPTLSCLASSFDTDLLYEVGVHLGEAALAEGVSIVLGPGLNIKRSPLCGRNFEYFSEDPCVSGRLAAAYVKGLQSTGVGACVKHFALNNQEYHRLMNESVVDDRALREIYLRGFEYVIKRAKPYEVMNSYNWYRGEPVSQCGYLLTGILRDEWGFEGVVVSDYASCDDRVKGLIAGQDVECPSSGDKLILKAIKKGTLDEKYVERAGRRQLKLLIKCNENLRPGAAYDIEKHHAFAARAAARSMVLLKNDGILPFAEDGTLAVIGEMAAIPRYQGCGSALVNPNILTSLIDSLGDAGIGCIYAPGYHGDDPADDALIVEAAAVAQKADQAILVVGLPDSYESESMDRRHMRLPESHYALIDAVTAANPHTVVVVCAGSPVEMPFAERVQGILCAYLGGEGVGQAIRDIVFGRVNPSGRLAETMPKKLEDNPSYHHFMEGTRSTQYRESLYVGYRYYDAARVEPLYPFGFGLSYTEFTYSGAKAVTQEDGAVVVSVTVTNTGERDGAEVVQLYIKNAKAAVYRPEKELRDFTKVFLQKGQSREVTMTLSRDDFAYWHPAENRWVVQSGEYALLIAASSADIRATLPVHIEGEAVEPPYEPLYYDDVTGNDFPLADFERVLGRGVPPLDRPADHPYDMNSSMWEIAHTRLGKRLFSLVRDMMCGKADTVEGNHHLDHLDTMIGDAPFRNLVQMSGGVFSYRMARGILLFLNHKRLRGLWIMFTSLPAAILYYVRF